MHINAAKFGGFLKHRKEFIRIDDTQRYKRARVQLHWKGIVLRDEIEGARIKTKEQQVARAGELLVAEIDAKVGGIGIVPPELDGAIVSSHYFLFEIDESKCTKSWLDWFVRSGGLNDQVTARGSTNYAAIRPHHVDDFELPLPDPDDQRHIVPRIEELAAKVEEARRLRHEAALGATALVESHLAKAFESLRERFGVRPLGSLLRDGGYGTSQKCDKLRLPGAFPVLRIPNVASERVNFNDMKYALLDDSELQRVGVRPGDILVVRTNGSIDLVGRCAVVPDLSEPTAFASYLVRLRCDTKQVNAEYVQLMLKHLRTNGNLVDFARTTAGQYNVSLGRLRAAEFPVPPPNEQEQVFASVAALQAKVAAAQKQQSETTTKLDALMSSILSKAFRGEL